MSKSVIASRYAKALINLVKKNDNLIDTHENLKQVALLFSNSLEFKELIESNKISLTLKNKILVDILKKIEVSKLEENFFLLLLKKNRFTLINFINKSFDEFYKEETGSIMVNIEASVPLSNEQIKNFEEKISFLTNKKVEIEIHINKKLLGGIVTKIGSTIIDGSLSNQLNLIRQSISQGGNL